MTSASVLPNRGSEHSRVPLRGEFIRSIFLGVFRSCVSSIARKASGEVRIRLAGSNWRETYLLRSCRSCPKRVLFTTFEPKATLKRQREAKDSKGTKKYQPSPPPFVISAALCGKILLRTCSPSTPLRASSSAQRILLSPTGKGCRRSLKRYLIATMLIIDEVAFCTAMP